MRWPRATAPAWPVHVAFAVAVPLFGTAYAMAGPDARTVIFSVATTLPVLAFIVAMWAGHLTDRRTWITGTVGLIVLALSMAHWPTWITDHHLGRAQGGTADLTIATGHGILLVGTAWALRWHGKNDSGGMLDAALLGLCAAAPVWAWLFAPNLTPDATLFGQMLALADLMVLCGVLSCLVRIGVRAKRSRGPISYLVLSIGMTLASVVCAYLTVHGSATWTSQLMMVAYLSVGPAVLLPAAPRITNPSDRIKPATGEPPLGWIGAALCTNPVMATVQAVRGDEAASVLLPVGSMLIVPLVLLRLKLLSAQRRQAQRELAYQAHHDELTGLLNRRHITARIGEALAELRAGDLGQVSVLLCDLDGFKPINDRYGHQAGDAVLRTIAVRLAGAVGGADLTGRIGGDEFIILVRGELPDGTVERITELVREPIQLDDSTVRVDVSIGVATAGRGEDLDRDAFISLADSGMYAAKAARGGFRTPRPLDDGRSTAAHLVPAGRL